MSEAKFKPGEYIIYQNGDSFETGKIKRVCDDGAFVWYSGGEQVHSEGEIRSALAIPGEPINDGDIPFCCTGVAK